MNAKCFNLTIDRQSQANACEAIAAFTGLSKSRTKQAMAKGAVWLMSPPRKEMRRLRRATAVLRPGDRIFFYYAPEILALQPPQAHCVEDYGQYSIWFKPAGLMSQGTRFGDHCALTRQAEQHFRAKRRIFPVHRLDRETAGLVILVHHSKAAALFSELFRDRKIEKRYMAWLRGDLARHQVRGSIDLKLGDQTALTEFEAMRYAADKDQTLVRIQIHTGRFHQIRRHFEMIGYPVMGDPRYGQDNKNQSGLQLVAYALAFKCPLGYGRVNIQIDPVKMGLL